MNYFIRFLFFYFVLICFNSCASDSIDDLIPVEPPEEDVTYTNTIKGIMDNNCVSCHSSPPINGAPIALTNYSEVKDATQNGQLINRIELGAGSPGAMPPASPLSAGNIQAINDWITDGYKE